MLITDSKDGPIKLILVSRGTGKMSRVLEDVFMPTIKIVSVIRRQKNSPKLVVKRDKVKEHIMRE